MSVAAVIPHYGDPMPTLRLVSQLAGQVDRIVVSDDVSPVPFPTTDGVDLVRREVNGGYGQAVNTGLQHVSEELTLILNSDLDVGPSFVSRLVAAAAPYQPCVAGPRIVTPAGRTSESARLFPTPPHQIVEWLTPLARFRDSGRWHRAVGHDTGALAAATPSETDWLVGAALLVPTAELRAVDGFDPRFFMNAEEVDLQRRLRARGLPSLYVPSVTVTHEGGGSTDPGKRREWLVDGRWLYAGKWGGTLPLATGLAAATAANLAWNGVRRLRGAPVHPLRVAKEELRLIRRARRPGYADRTTNQERP